MTTLAKVTVCRYAAAGQRSKSHMMQKLDSAFSEHMAATAPKAGLCCPEVPSTGSIGHRTGTCKPCVFLHTKGCQSGSQCQFCHLCGPDEKKQRQKAKRLHFQQVRTTRANESLPCLDAGAALPALAAGLADVCQQYEMRGGLPLTKVYSSAEVPMPRAPMSQDLDAMWLQREIVTPLGDDEQRLDTADVHGVAIIYQSLATDRRPAYQAKRPSFLHDFDPMCQDSGFATPVQHDGNRADVHGVVTTSPEQISDASSSSDLGSESSVMERRMRRQLQTPSLLQLLGDPEELPYVVRNTFIETSFGTPTPLAGDFCGRASLSCPASKIGSMHLTVQTDFEDADSLSTIDFASSVPETPQSLLSALWPPTPETTNSQGTSCFTRMLFQGTSIEATTDVLAMPWQPCLALDATSVTAPETPQSLPGTPWPPTPESTGTHRSFLFERMSFSTAAIEATTDVLAMPWQASLAPAGCILQGGAVPTHEQLGTFPYMGMPVESWPQDAMLAPFYEPTLFAPAIDHTIQHSDRTHFAGSRILTLAEVIDFPVQVTTDSETPSLEMLPSLGSAGLRLGSCKPCGPSLDTLPSLGSIGHSHGNCKPCGFLHKAGCGSGLQCNFCHLCEPGEKKRRQREKRETFRDTTRLKDRRAAAGGA